MKLRLTLAAIILAILSPAAGADTVNPLRPAVWNAFEPPGLIRAALWNNTSYDGNGQCNIGYWLANVAGCTYPNFYAGSPNVRPNFLGDSTTTWSVTKEPETTSVTVTATRLQVTDYQLLDELGWFNVPATGGTPTLTPLFSGLGIPGASVTFVPTGNYGFYVKTPEGTYLSTGEGDTRTHFSVFQLPGDGHYLLGMEDMWTRSDWDYNDAAFEVQFNAVPEPATLLLLGSGLVGLGAAVRKRRR